MTQCWAGSKLQVSSSKLQKRSNPKHQRCGTTEVLSACGARERFDRSSGLTSALIFRAKFGLSCGIRADLRPLLPLNLGSVGFAGQGLDVFLPKLQLN